MKKVIIASLIMAMVVSLGIAYAEAPAEGFTGNGAPKAKLLGKLNIIGVKNPKNENMDNDGGSVIFVDLEGKNKIALQEGEDFQVLDKNATDNDGALFELPEPNLSPYNVTSGAGKTDTQSAYSVFVRPLGKPGGFATITTCAELLDPNFAGLLSGKFVSTLNKACEWDEALASVEQVGQDILTRQTGKSTFTNVTAELLTIVFKVEVQTGVDALGNPITIIEYVRVPIFDDIIQGEYWEYDNDKLKLCQVRFYDVPTDVALSDDNWNNE
ncbi:MAG TPA: hypothetical protein VMX13_17920 [Sedimentisphaerales bacterium]|nr:hypothetical protein [Sedimentisphaerales bacterium]